MATAENNLTVEVAATSSVYATFLSQLGASSSLTHLHVIDANNGIFNTSLAKFRWVYNPTGNGGTGMLYWSLLETTGGYVFQGAVDIQNHINSILTTHLS